MKRGDVILVRFPHPSGGRGKKRPAVVLQADRYHASLHTVVVAEVTTNLTMANDPACLLIDITTADGQTSGLLRDSVVSCLLIATIKADNVDCVMGTLSDALKQRLSECVKAALDIV
jgi:mRNA interferase MazF